MTPDALLKAVDLTDLAASSIPSGSVAKTMLRNTRIFWAVRREQRFLIVLKVSVGPRGGVLGHIYLRDIEITPAVDSIRVGEVPYFGSDKLLPLSNVFSNDGDRVIPDEPVILDFLQRTVNELPEDIGFYEDCLAHGLFDAPGESIRCLEGGATGLHS